MHLVRLEIRGSITFGIKFLFKYQIKMIFSVILVCGAMANASPMLECIRFVSGLISNGLIVGSHVIPVVTATRPSVSSTKTDSQMLRMGLQNAGCYNSNLVSCLWWNDYHPGQAIQSLVAESVSKLIKSRAHAM